MKGKKKELKKQESKEEDEEVEDKEEGEEEGMEASAKSDDLSEDDLEKSLAQLEAVAAEGDEVSRKEQLLTKAQSEDLSKSENEELFKLLGGESQDEETLAEELIKGFGDNEEINKGIDVSEFLEESTSELTKSLGLLADHIEKSGTRQHGFNILLSRAISETGRATVETNTLIKSVAQRLGVIENQPARAPKARRSAAQPLEKSMGGRATGAGAGDLTKAQVDEALTELLTKSVDEGRAGATEYGVKLDVEASKFEQFGRLHPAVMEDVVAHIASKRNAPCRADPE